MTKEVVIEPRKPRIFLRDGRWLVHEPFPYDPEMDYAACEFVCRLNVVIATKVTEVTGTCQCGLDRVKCAQTVCDMGD
jgi:hypothetical protein